MKRAKWVNIMKMAGKYTILGLAAASVLSACGGGSVTNDGGFTNYETFEDLALSAEAQAAFDQFELLNDNGSLINSNPGSNAVFETVDGAVFRFGDGDATDVVYVGDFNAIFDVGDQEVSVTIDQITNTETDDVVSGSIGINATNISNGTFNGGLGSIPGTFFEGLGGSMQGAYVAYDGSQYILTKFSGSNDDGILRGVGSGEIVPD